MAAALGWKFLDDQYQPVAPCPAEFLRIRQIVPRDTPLSWSVTGLATSRTLSSESSCDARLRSAKRRDARNADQSGGVPESSRSTKP